MSIQTINPTTGEVLETFEPYSEQQVNQALDQARQAFLHWRTISFAERGKYLHSVASHLRDRKTELARIAVLEMGKSITEAEAEVEKCAWNCDFFAENAESFLRDEKVASNASESYVAFRPLGVVLAIMPWNFPYWQVFRFAAPALMAGNTTVLKHASNVSRVALEIERIFQEAGLPQGVLRTVLVPGSETGRLIEDSRIAAVTLTGSEAAGVEVAATSGHVLKKTVLELGGSDPYIILADADIEASVRTCAASRLINSGQSCIAAKRFIVVESIREQVEARFVTEMQTARMGDPLEEDTTMGPLARHDLRDDVHQQVQASIAKGAHCLLGGTIPEGPGAFYPPTVLTHVRKGMPAYDEELFGPVAAIIAVADEAEAIRAANDSSFGLGAAVFTQDKAKGERLAAQELEAGCCFVNTFVRSDPRLPFGGVKTSGYGRELSHYGIKEFMNIKTVYVQ